MKTNCLLSRLALGLAFVLVLGCLILVSKSVSSTQSPLIPGSPTPYPKPNTHTALPTTTVFITYDEPISPTTVSTQTFAVHAMQTGLLMQTYGVQDGTISLTPPQPFQPGELVHVSATTGTLSLLDGTGPVSPTVWQFRVAVTNGSAAFISSGQSWGESFTGEVALGDLDGDGDVDAFVTNRRTEPNKVWLNDGTGTFSDSGQSLGGADSWHVALGDLDGDSDLDAFVAQGGRAEQPQPNKVWMNDGTGAFVDSGQNLGNSASWGVALGDVDGDGDLDAFVANYNYDSGNRANRVWINDGTGLFSDSGQMLSSPASTGVDLGDLDEDGDLDAFVANQFQPSRVWMNDGTGLFTDSGQYLGEVSGDKDVALGDLDGDGDLDAFVANQSESIVWLNNGTGTFTNSGQSLVGSGAMGIALGDLDGDGDLDAFFAMTISWDGGPNKVWLNDGTGTFSDSGQILGEAFSEGVTLGDVDGDGDLDAFVANGGPGGHPNAVWVNRNVQRIYLPIVLR